jgi:Fic family protein
VPGADPDEARELLNYRRAFEFVSEYLDTGAPITESLIRERADHLAHPRVTTMFIGQAQDGDQRGDARMFANLPNIGIVVTAPWPP